MSKSALRKLWSFFALFGLSFAIFAFLRSAGQETEKDAFGILGLRPPEVPVLAFPLEILMSALVVWLTDIWARTSEGRVWAARLPIFYFEEEGDVDPTHPGGKIYQGAAGIIFVALPVLLMIHMGALYLRGSIFFSVRGRCDRIPLHLNWLDHFYTAKVYSAAPDVPGIFLYGTDHGPQYYPLVTWLYFFLAALVLLYAAVTVKHVLSAPRLK